MFQEAWLRDWWLNPHRLRRKRGWIRSGAIKGCIALRVAYHRLTARSLCKKFFMTWACPQCHRIFRQVNQRHACGVGSPDALLKNRPAALVDLYQKLEATVRGFGGVEVVTRNRYALFRTTRIFADLTVMRDALRVVIHLSRKAAAPCFIKVAQGDKRVAHVALVRTVADLRVITPFLLEAFKASLREAPRGPSIVSSTRETGL
jgi:hypothetical protein